jgi:hypothetical protein
VLRTYTLFLYDGTEPPRFEPALCRTPAEAMERAREVLDRSPECRSVEVFFGETRLFEVLRG